MKQFAEIVKGRRIFGSNFDQLVDHQLIPARALRLICTKHFSAPATADQMLRESRGGLHPMQDIIERQFVRTASSIAAGILIDMNTKPLRMKLRLLAADIEYRVRAWTTKSEKLQTAKRPETGQSKAENFRQE